MRKIVHLSDLHFGRDRPELLRPLLRAVADADPDLVVISGDLTQRARNRQFRAARAFLDRIPAPVLAVPGNHDVPLDNLFLRFLMPWRRYRRWIGAALEPTFSDAEISVVGVNTVNPWSWQRGRIDQRAVRRVCDAFGPVIEGPVRIVVAHHPFEHEPGQEKRLMRGAAAAVDALSACGADIVLTGHLHTWAAGPFAARKGRRGALQVQAGTGLSTRRRGEENDFNLLSIERGRVQVERFVAGRDNRFVRAAGVGFTLGERGWEREAAARDAAPVAA